MGTLLLTPGRERCGAAHEQLLNDNASRTFAAIAFLAEFPRKAVHLEPSLPKHA